MSAPDLPNKAPQHAPMTGFPAVDGSLIVGGMPIERLAQRVGQTPFYVYERRLLDERVALLRQHFPKEVKLHYAMKANPMPAVVGHMARQVDGLDVASGRELRVALDTGMDPHEISFAGPGKADVELVQAVASGILLNVESPHELQRLITAAKIVGVKARVALRVNPDFELKSSGMKMGGGPKQFGIDAAQIPAVLAEVGRHDVLAFEGFHIYSGSQNLRAASICEAQGKSFDLAVRVAADAPAPVRTLNLGGGLGIPYFPGELPVDVSPIGASLAEIVARARVALPQCEIVIELGRYLVGEAGLYICRIVDRKISRDQVFLVTDGGLHHHLAASGNFGQVIRKNYPVTIANRQGGDREIASVVGPLCTPLDLLADRMLLPVAYAGDLVAVYQSGAYGPTASPAAFLSHPLSVEILV